MDMYEIKIPTKNRFTEAERNEITTAMRMEGFSNYRNYVMHMVRTRAVPTDAECRRKQQWTYTCSNLNTYYNQIREGINVDLNMHRFVREAGRLCRELK